MSTSERKIFRPSTVAITSPPTGELHPIKIASSAAAENAAAAWAENEILFKAISPVITITKLD
ncbi:hypothetical protein SBA1_50062 [Candidatus Sulfotelmatobacter kueseliae]|uniref:Uncharacterized protein n=1 Tax=Candidatus Sulfotelmatobacter kueseliae TaxID=2042962 RepID=A0A2U3KVI1_9BACT|nr:hypothetical protein SBA1_50062 [Candidatus Sulfotelmatobacter kueseliae]